MINEEEQVYFIKEVLNKMDIPEHMCKICFIGITNPYQIETGICHDCSMIEIGRESILNQAEKLRGSEMNKHKKKDKGEDIKSKKS